MRLRTPYVAHPWMMVRKVMGKLRGPRPSLSALRVPQEGGALPDVAGPIRAWTGRLRPTCAGVPWSWAFGEDNDEDQMLGALGSAGEHGEGPEKDLRWRWEIGRLHPLIVNAALAPESDRDRVARDGARWLERWQEAVGTAPGGGRSCAMEVALRAVNLLAADSLLDGRLAEAVGGDRWRGLLWNCGSTVWSGLEAGRYPSNHYLADLLGLLWVGRAFPRKSEARRWAEFAQAEFPRAVLRQTEADGGLDEASMPYHAFATEMVLAAILAAPDMAGAAFVRRVDAMVQAAIDGCDCDGSSIAFGDDDGGRVWPLDRVCAGGRAVALASLAAEVRGGTFSPRPDTLYPRSGWWMARAGRHAAFLEFGGVGMNGLGSHAHNDDLSICCDWNGAPAIVDPGSCLYTGSPTVRNRYRSTAVHNTVQVDGVEQRPLAVGGGSRDLFQLRGAARAWPVVAASAGTICVERTAPALSETVRHRRTVSIAAAEIRIEDRLAGRRPHSCRWTFQLASSLMAVVVGDGFLIRRSDGDGFHLQVVAPGAALSVESSYVSPVFGRQVPALCCVVTAPVRGSFDASFRLHPVS